MYFLTDLEARNLRLRCWQGSFLLRTVSEGSFRGLSPWFGVSHLFHVSLHIMFLLRTSVCVHILSQVILD